MSKFLKQSVAEKFNSIRLDEAQIKELETRLSEDVTPAEQVAQRHKSMWYRVVIVVLVVLSIPVAQLTYNYYQSNRLISEIALEAAENHLKLKPLEVTSGELSEVLAYFDGLGFSLVASDSITGLPGDRLLGGRYCSIKGIDAAQIRVLSSDGSLSTWYEGMLKPEQFKFIPNVDQGELPESRTIKGLQVQVWQERGVLFVEAR